MGAYFSSMPMKMCRTSSSHTVNSGRIRRGRKVLFCFLAGLTASPAAAAALDPVVLLCAGRSDLEERFVSAEERSALEEERVDLADELRLDLPPEERVEDAEDEAAGLVPSSYLAASARDVPAALSAS